MLWTGHAWQVPGKCFPGKARVFKTEAGDALPFGLRIEKEELQVQGNGFHLVRGRNIQPHQLCTGIRQKTQLWFSGTAGKGERGTEWREEGTSPAVYRRKSSRKGRYRRKPRGCARGRGAESCLVSDRARGVVSCYTRPRLTAALSHRKSFWQQKACWTGPHLRSSCLLRQDTPCHWARPQGAKVN